MASPREVSLAIFRNYLKEWTQDAGVPWTGHGRYVLEIGISNDNITSLKLTDSKASISLK